MVLANCLAASSDSACPLNATGGGCTARSAQCVHFEIFGACEFHSAVGTSHGHASMQYRQPMQSSTLYDTGPSSCRYSAVVGQAETHPGSRQCRQRCMTNADSTPPGFSAFSVSWNAMRVNVLALSVAGFWKPSGSSNSVCSPSCSFHCLHAT